MFGRIFHPKNYFSKSAPVLVAKRETTPLDGLDTTAPPPPIRLAQGPSTPSDQAPIKESMAKPGAEDQASA